MAEHDGLKIAFVMDPLSTLSVKKDSTLAMIRAAQRRGWHINYLRQQDLLLAEGEPRGLTRSLELVGKFAEALLPEDADDGCYRLGEPEMTPLADLDIIMMRKDPPFDMEYIYSTYLLERAQSLGVRVVNDPRSLRDCNEKLFATAFPQCCPPLVVSRREDVLRDFHKTHKNVVFKRLDGMGGTSVFRIMENDPNLTVVLGFLY